MYYHDYLQLDRLLGAQRPLSTEQGRPAHDELLFIVVHQAYELWFKQILHELEAVRAVFDQPAVPERSMGRVVGHLERVHTIQRVLIDHLDVLETMTPLDFLEFRDLLVPASGFQSLQFRLIENLLGLDPGQPDADQRMRATSPGSATSTGRCSRSRTAGAASSTSSRRGWSGPRSCRWASTPSGTPTGRRSTPCSPGSVF